MSKKVAIVCGTVLAIMLTTGTVNADKKKSTLWGAGIGAIAGSLLGGNFSDVSTMAVHRDGATETWVESYRIVDDIMVISGEDAKTGETYVVNAKYSVDENQPNVVASEARFVFTAVR